MHITPSRNNYTVKHFRHFQSLRSSVAQGIIGKHRSNWYKRQFDTMVSKLFTKSQTSRFLKGKRSEYKPTPSGVPHGSVLDPLLLLIYI